MVRVIAVILSLLAAGLYLYAKGRDDGRQAIALGHMCFDDAGADKTRISDCGAVYEAGGERAEEALDTQLALYVRVRNFEGGRRAVTSAIESGLTAPRWLFWQAYFNEKRGVDQPPMAELIEQVKEHSDFITDQRSVWSDVKDETYVMAQLAALEEAYGQDLWFQRQKGWLHGAYGHIEESFAVLERLVEENPTLWGTFEDFIAACHEYPNECPKLHLVPEEEKLTFTCESALLAFKQLAKVDERFQKTHPSLGIRFIEAFDVPQLVGTQSLLHYNIQTVELIKGKDRLRSASMMLPLAKLVACYHDSPESVYAEYNISLIQDENFNEFAQVIVWTARHGDDESF